MSGRVAFVLPIRENENGPGGATNANRDLTHSSGTSRQEGLLMQHSRLPLDLTGQRFGRLVAIEQAETINARTRWECLCDCGRTTVVRTASLRDGNTVSCGCKRVPDFTGLRFGFLTVLGLGGRRPSGRLWACACDCGDETLVSSGDLQAGHTKSCGCYSREQSSKRNSRDMVTYDGAHLRLRYTKGSAGQYFCVDCNRRAQEWSYDHKDPNALCSERNGCLYSLEMEHYEPRCRRCHYKLDKLHGRRR